MIQFKKFGRKAYARTATGGFAFGDTQGLYQWHRGFRIDYTGGDRQCSDADGMYSLGTVADAAPMLLGLIYAVSTNRRN